MTNDTNIEGRRPLELQSGVERRNVLELGAGLAGALIGGLGSLGTGLMAAGQAGASSSTGITLTQGVRRVVTGHNAQGRSYIIRDDRVTGGAFPSLYKATGEEPLGPAPSGEPQKI